MSESIDPATAQLVLWRQLVAAGCRAGVRYEDAQDLASQTIHRALSTHDAERGPFAPFCRTIHANLLKNHWRDRKPSVEFDPETDGGVVFIDPQVRLEILEGREMLRDIADSILAALEPAEAALFLVLADLCRESERAAVSEAARRLGLEPLQGWDLFRRIQRKARAQVEEFRRLGEVAMQDDVEMQERAESPASLPVLEAYCLSAAPEASPDDGATLLLLCAFGLTAGHERFAAALTPAERERLAALLC